VVAPDRPAHKPNADAREHDKGVAEQGLPGEGRQHLRYYTHGGQNQNVYLWVTENPEQVLPQHWVAAFAGPEEIDLEQTVKG
jgi:hypothetical protein